AALRYACERSRKCQWQRQPMRRRRWRPAHSRDLQTVKEDELPGLRESGIRDPRRQPHARRSTLHELYARRACRVGRRIMAALTGGSGIGAGSEETVLVTSENAIKFLGLEAARVLSTPHMIGYMERTCRNLVFPLLEPGYDTVGTHVDVAHLAAAPLGMAVRF